MERPRLFLTAKATFGDGSWRACLALVLQIITGLGLLAPQMAEAQVLLTGENGGKGSQSIMVSANAIVPRNYTVLANVWAQYGYGLANRADLFASYGNITAFGWTQHYASLGLNLGLVKRRRAGVDLSFYNNASIPFNRRHQACTVLLSSAVVVSRPVKLGRRSFTPYGGFSRLHPIGHRADKVFTPGKVVQSFIAGVAIPLGSAITLFLEYQPGHLQHSAGAGVVYVLPRREEPRGQSVVP